MFRRKAKWIYWRTNGWKSDVDALTAKHLTAVWIHHIVLIAEEK